MQYSYTPQRSGPSTSSRTAQSVASDSRARGASRRSSYKQYRLHVGFQPCEKRVFGSSGTGEDQEKVQRTLIIGM